MRERSPPRQYKEDEIPVFVTNKNEAAKEWNRKQFSGSLRESLFYYDIDKI